MIIKKFGEIQGDEVQSISIENENGLRAKFITYGARLTELHVPDRNGELADIVLGFDDLDSYLSTDIYFGATCGRYGNRITKGSFQLYGEDYQVDQNEGLNHLHGGIEGFHAKNWDFQINDSRNILTFTSVSDDGEMGFPGRCELKVTYELTNANKLLITMTANTDKTTIMNMVHHSYFNLAGYGSGDIRNQQVKINSRFFTPVNKESITTGEVLSVAGTPFDFTTMKAIGENIDDLGGVFDAGGYDHNWCIDGEGMRPSVEVYDPKSGRRMLLETTEPGVQFYTGGHLSEDIIAKQGIKLCKYAGFALETQKYPDTPNNSHFPNCILQPDETYVHELALTFSTD